MISLTESIRLAAQNLLNQLSARRGTLPIWKVDIEPDGRGTSLFSWPMHNVGRITDALFRVEAATGAPVPPDVEEALRSGLRRALDNPLGVASMIYGVTWERETNRAGMFDAHSQRETLLALAMLVRHRDDPWALQSGRRMVDSLGSLIKQDGSWEYERFTGALEESPQKLALERLASTEPMDLTYSHGRLIEALVEFAEASEYEPALRLAGRLARFHMGSRPPAERVKEGEWLHHHSLFNTYRGIFRYGLAAGDEEACRFSARVVEDEALPRLTESGYIPETEGAWDPPETSSPGDAAQLALWVARWKLNLAPGRADGAGRLSPGELLDHVERLVRARLLPSQLLVSLDFRATEDGSHDPHGETDTAPAELLRARALGAYGGVHRHPYGHARPTTDVTAATLHSICDVASHTLTVGDDRVGVELLFDAARDDVVVSTRTTVPDTDESTAWRTVAVTMAAPRDVAIRVPGWTDAASVRGWVGAGERTVEVTDGYARVGQSELATSGGAGGSGAKRYSVTLRFPLPARTTTERAAGGEYRLRWRGDEVVSISPNAPFLAFYPSGEG